MSAYDVVPPPLRPLSAPTQQSQPPAAGSVAQTPPSTAPEDVRESPAPSALLAQDAPQSQPMTATASSSSINNAAAENGDDSQNIYGTRSRNRTGGARPNYADDRELDLEIEATGRISKLSSKKSAAAGASNAATVPANSGFAPVDATNLPNGDAAAQSAGTPGPTSSAPSKKRKQPGSSTVISAPPVPYTLDTRSRFCAPTSYVETNMMSFQRCGSRLNAKKQLVADDGTALSADDHAYLVCEPPGEPYYLARIMEFLHAGNDATAPVDAVRVNWYYRPKDIGRRVQDTRVVFASMHSDTCPLASLRSKCNIQHLNDIQNLEEYRKEKDSFWFDKLYDRYMHRYYEVVPTSKVVNVPPRVKHVLDERWKFVLIEVGRSRDLTTESKRCIRCEQFAANNDSVDCAVCKSTYHMRCVRPPLLKKPARGFAWACAACSRRQELRLEARDTPTLSESAMTGEDERLEDDDEDVQQLERDTRESSLAPQPHPEPTAAQIAQANLWPWRYLGVHSRPEDALDYDDRIYPRASSRLGPRHQANVSVWHGRPVELVKPSDIKKKYLKHAGSKKDGKLTKDTVAAIEADKEHRLKRPKWVVDEPIGYVPRGEDEPIEVKGKKDYTAQLTFKMPDASKFTERGGDDPEPPSNPEALVEEYMAKVKALAAQYDVETVSVDFLTKAVEKLQENNYNIEKALTSMKGLSKRADLKLPDLNREEVKRFEEGVQKYGSELHAVSRHVGSSVKESRIVRFYYMWKKTEKGRQIWGNYEGRRSKKESRKLDKDGSGKLVDDVADDADDSAYDNEKAHTKKRGFECKFCATRSSRQWRRAPATAPGTLVPRDAASKNSKDKSTWLALALCGRCAYLWRRYAIVYEHIDEVAKKIAAAGGRASKRKVDEELLRTTFEAHYTSGDLIPSHVASEIQKSGVEIPVNIIQQEEPPKKKVKPDKEPAAVTPEVVPEKKKPVEKVPEAPLEPEPPRVKIHPCAICHVIEIPGHELLKCRDCRLHVHGACYGVPEPPSKPWFCDMCRNDHNLQVSTIYECLLCPVTHTPQELMEPLKVSHKKKTDREREKERLEREMVQEASRRWRQEQEAAGRPVNPREALKRTAWNNWIHITCALWTKEIKFGNAKLLDDAEGVGYIPRERFEQQCKVCRKQGEKPTIKCNSNACNAYYHVGCAHQANHIFGFDVTPVKSSRRDSVNIMKLDQEAAGIVTPGIWCPSHAPTTYVHSMVELTEDGRTTALQKFCETYKQADSSITGTVRRAAQFMANLQTTAPPVQPPQRQVTSINGILSGPITERAGRRSMRSSPALSRDASLDAIAVDSDGDVKTKRGPRTTDKKCCTCLVDASPKWWKIPRNPPDQSASPTANGIDLGAAHPLLNGTAQSIPDDHNDTQPSSSDQPPDTIITNGIVKSEPTDSTSLSATPLSADDCMYQCHKCHVQKKSPPSSPSQIRPRERPRPEPVPEPAYQPPPAFTAPPPSSFPFSRSSFDSGPPHSHPIPPSSSSHHSPWPGGPAQWSAPVMRNGAPPSNGPPMYDSPPFRPDNSYPFGPPRPGPPPFGSGHSTNGGHQHSPPPGPFGMPAHQHAPPPRGSSGMPARAPSPPRSGYDYSPPAGLGIGTSSGLSRPYPPQEARRASIESPVRGFSSAARGPFSVANPSSIAPPPRPSSTHTQSLVQIAQAAEAAGPGPMAHSRQASGEGHGMPRATVRAMDGYSRREYPSQTTGGRPVTPSVGGLEGTSSYYSADAWKEIPDQGRGAPGASGSPSLRNLLS